MSGELTIKPSKDMLLGLTLEVSAGMAATVFSLPWTLLEASEGEFVSSDRPLTMRDPSPPYPWSGPGWMSSPLVQATMPLSPSACLMVRPIGNEMVTSKKAKNLVKPINLRTYGWASRYIYGASEQVLLDLHETALAEPTSVERPARKAMVMLEDIATADPKVADKNAAKGWPRYIPDPSCKTNRLMSYEVVFTEEEARRSVAARQRDGHEEEVAELL